MWSEWQTTLLKQVLLTEHQCHLVEIWLHKRMKRACVEAAQARLVPLLVHLKVTHVTVGLDSQGRADYNGDTESCARIPACINSALCSRMSVPVLSSSAPRSRLLLSSIKAAPHLNTNVCLGR